ncbi:hypothetical protein [Kineococcus sp. SYSU DK018]|uniref:hypothetical protein n=1 Tax=Kineococcus sp. SYSU DK018 TaxID=3383139 RepID=UPI003D7EACB2
MTTLIVTFVLVVGLAASVLLSVAAPPLRARGSRFVARLDALAARWAPVVLRAAHHGRDRARRTAEHVAQHAAQRLAAHRAHRDEAEAARAR